MPLSGVRRAGRKAVTVDLESLYDAATAAGLLTEVIVGGAAVMAEFRAPDEPVLDGLALSTEYAIRYPASRLPDLAAGDTVQIAGRAYQVREVHALGEGTEHRATLTRL